MRMPDVLDTPVLLIIFNRPECTRKVFEKIKLVKPKKLFVVADGPREGNELDVVKCKEARSIVEDVDWDCEVYCDFSNQNLGCGHRPASGLDWVFKQVNEAIILEDDCVPEESFFWFCQELLRKYKDDKRVYSISGNNYQKRSVSNDSYYFSAIPQTWGWATWKRVWREYDYRIKMWPELKEREILNQMFSNKRFANMWENVFDQVYDGRISSAWDYQFVFLSFLNQGLNILPQENLVKYIGFGDTATHTEAMNNALMQFVSRTSKVEFPLKHPAIMRNDCLADTNDMIVAFACEPTFLRAVVARFSGLLNKLYKRMHVWR